MKTMKGNYISRQKAIEALGRKVQSDAVRWKSASDHYDLGEYTQWRKDVGILEKVPAGDVVNRKELIETIKHYMQYPDGMSRLLEVYGGNDGEDDIKRDM